MSAIYVEITRTRGSAPRDAGTVMKVTAEGIFGTIGGGALEHRAIARARQLLRDGATSWQETIPLGPGLGQCCGGSVSLRFSDSGTLALPEPPPPTPAHAGPARPLWVWGAGHVGRAIVAQAAPSGAFDITWIDDAPDRYPVEIPANVTTLPAADMPRAVAFAPADAHHLILTYSHDIDLKLCAALLRHGFAFCGLIGSDTKRARFAKRLSEMGLDPARITCPIGDKSLGKHPDRIAAGTIRALLPAKETA